MLVVAKFWPMKHQKTSNPDLTVGEIHKSSALRVPRNRKTLIITAILLLALIAAGAGIYVYKTRASKPAIAESRKLTKQEKQLKQAYASTGQGPSKFDQLIKDAKTDNAKNDLLYQKAQFCVSIRDYSCSMQTYENLFNGSDQKNIQFGLGVVQAAIQVKDTAKATDYIAKLKVLIDAVDDKNAKAKEQADLSNLEKQLHG